VVSGNDTILHGQVNGIDVYGAGAAGTVIAGNRIGTDPSGTKALPNQGCGLYLGLGYPFSPTLSGSADGATITGNLISGNGSDGILSFGSSRDLIRGNTIGTDLSGFVALPNAESGIVVRFEGGDSTIGGTTAADRNLISGNARLGVWILGAANNLI